MLGRQTWLSQAHKHTQSVKVAFAHFRLCTKTDVSRESSRWRTENGQRNAQLEREISTEAERNKDSETVQNDRAAACLLDLRAQLPLRCAAFYAKEEGIKLRFLWTADRARLETTAKCLCLHSKSRARLICRLVTALHCFAWKTHTHLASSRAIAGLFFYYFLVDLI